MPTGYTAALYEGTEQTFPEFLMGCARAFGALIVMRDDGPNVPIPDEFKPQTEYHDEAIAKAKADLLDLTDMTTYEAERRAKAEFESLRARREEAAHKAAALRCRYEAMLAQVHDWTPPTPDHEGLKKFMVEQLEESIRFDASHPSWPEYLPMSGQAWRADRIAKAERDIAYHEEQRAAEIERTNGRNAWVKALRSSVENGGGQTDG